MYLKRNIENRILSLSKMYKVVLITGARQIGKTTMLKEIKNLAKNDPKLFLQRYEAPLITNEIQYATELLSYIKAIVDNTN